MPIETRQQINTKLSPEELMRAKREAEHVKGKIAKDNGGKEKKYGEALGKDSFLKLLVEELKQQDPTNPMKDREFISQMAQISSLEQMHNVGAEMKKMNERSHTSEGYSLLGKKIQGVDAVTGQIVEGEVTHVVKKGSQLLLAVGNHEVKIDDVHAVFPVVKAQTPVNKASNPVQQQPQYDIPALDTINDDIPEEIVNTENSEKGVMNSFNKFEILYDNNNRLRQRAVKAYNAK